MILWDQTSKVEHFIRQATIRTGSPDLAFLVPTPETPELAEVDPAIFDRVSAIGQPERVRPVIYHEVKEFFAPIAYHFQGEPADEAPPPSPAVPPIVASNVRPTVLAEADVAGYHATVLATDDYPSIASWLAQNGYNATPELEAWLKKYGARKWKITAFKMIKPDAGVGYLTTRAVRLSFHTPAPFYPYSEPGDRQKASAASPLGRALRVAVLSNARMSGSLADQTLWPGKLEYAGPARLSLAQQEGKPWTPAQWLADAGLDHAGNHPAPPSTLTTFLDESNPRPGTADLYFAPNADQSAFRGTEVDYSLPVEYRMTPASALAAFGAYLFVFLVPIAPLYCGWRVHCRYRARNLSLAKAQRPPRGWVRIFDRFMGAAAVLLGIAYALHYFLHVAPYTLLGYDSFDPSQAPDATALATGGVIMLGIGALCIAVISSGILIWRSKFAVPPDIPPHRSRWPLVFGDFSLFAGGLGIFLMLGMLIQLPEI